MAVRKHFPHNGSHYCRMCDCFTENILHLAECTQLKPTFSRFTTLLNELGIKAPYDNATLLLGCVPSTTDVDCYTTLPQSRVVNGYMDTHGYNAISCIADTGYRWIQLYPHTAVSAYTQKAGIHKYP